MKMALTSDRLSISLPMPAELYTTTTAWAKACNHRNTGCSATRISKPPARTDRQDHCRLPEPLQSAQVCPNLLKILLRV